MNKVRWFTVLALLGAWTLVGGITAGRTANTAHAASASAVAASASGKGSPAACSFCTGGGGACARVSTVVRAARVTAKALDTAARVTVESLRKSHSGS